MTVVRTITKTVTVAANETGTTPILTGIVGKTRNIKFLRFEPVTGLTLVGFQEQDQLVEVTPEVYAVDSNPIPLNLELREGESFKAGFKNTTAGSLSADVCIFYEES